MKIQIEIKTPGNGKVYEFQVDPEMKVGSAKKKIIGEIRELEKESIYLDEENSMIFDGSKECILAEDLTMDEAEVMSGREYILL